MKKQIVSTLLALCMLLCLMPTAAFAEESTETPPVCSCETACTAESMNTDCPVCGAEGALPESCAKCAQPADAAAVQPEGEVSDPQPETALTALSGEGATPAAGETVRDVRTADELTAAIADSSVNTVKLAGDISISSSLTVNRTVTLDLNGQVLKYVGENEGSVIVVEGSGKLTLTDSNTAAEHKFMPGTNGLWVLDEENGKETVTGGVITGGTGTDISTFGGTTWYCGGGALIKNGGSLTMRGGNIIGCSATDGGGVCADPLTNQTSQFSMSGGSIAGCVASDIGGGVFASGTFKMSGPAVIRSCTAESATQFVCGGGVYVDGDGNVVTFEPTGAAVNAAMQQACGDNKSIFKLVIMHSAVATNLENLRLLKYMTYTDEDGIQRDLSLGTWNGRLVLVDDGMPTEAVAADSGKGTAAYTKYTTYVLGEGSIILDDIGDAVPYEMSRDPKTNGGQDTLYVRDGFICGVQGLSFEKPASITASATNADLSTGANWSVINDGTNAIPHKSIALAKIVSKG